MPVAVAPLFVTVEIELQSGPAVGERRFRLSHQIELPPVALRFERALPVEGTGEGRVRLTLPGGALLEAAAILHHDPERPDQGSVAELVGLGTAAMLAVQTYIEQRNAS
jgi:hypothetical protein